MHAILLHDLGNPCKLIKSNSFKLGFSFIKFIFLDRSQKIQVILVEGNAGWSILYPQRFEVVGASLTICYLQRRLDSCHLHLLTGVRHEYSTRSSLPRIMTQPLLVLSKMNTSLGWFSNILAVQSQTELQSLSMLSYFHLFQLKEKKLINCFSSQDRIQPANFVKLFNVYNSYKSSEVTQPNLSNKTV